MYLNTLFQSFVAVVVADRCCERMLDMDKHWVFMSLEFGYFGVLFVCLF